MAIEIVTRVWQVGGADLTAREDAAAYLIRLGPAAALIDAGTGHGHRQLMTNIAWCLPEDVPLAYLLLTHCHFDHTGGAEAVRRDLGCRIVAHELDAVYLENGDSEVTAASWYGENQAPLQIDMKLDQPQTSIPVGSGILTAVHWPGHSPGSVVYYAEVQGQRVLFGQDVHGPLHPSLLSDEKQYRESLEALLVLDADILLEGHFGIFRGKSAVRRFIRSYLREP
jgi:glyoxylase-like metal-dependent hydrolase (beta-lactamase superfamily II)